MVDVHQALKFAVDITKGMEFLHSMEPVIPNLAINSKHILVSELLIGLLFCKQARGWWSTLYSAYVLTFIGCVC